MLFKLRFTLLLAIALLTLVGCSKLQFPGVHTFDIQQGNVITQEMIDQLKPGMNKSQVRFVMGTPLIADSFNQNRWDYLYSIKKSNGEEEREQVTILFDKAGLLTSLEGDYLPTSATQKSE